MVSKLHLFWAVSLFVAASSAFEIAEVRPKVVNVKEGEPFELFCAVDGYWEWCTFRHAEKLCDFVWLREPWDVTVEECDDYEGRVTRTGDYNYYQCGIKLSAAMPEDDGKWTCEFESYHAGKTRNYGYKTNATMTVNVEIKTTTPPPTTTTTTTPPSSSSSSSTTLTTMASLDEAQTEKKYMGDTEKPTKHANDESDFSVTYIVVAVVIVIILVVACILIVLHYKKRLPDKFYNLGGKAKDFKPVDTEDDVKKHPTIVKNGANGSSPSSPAHGDDANDTIDEEANINPEMTTVTWTSDEKNDNDVDKEENKPLREGEQ